MNNSRVNSNIIYVQGVGNVQGVQLNDFLIAIVEIENQTSPNDPKLIHLVIANTTNTIKNFNYDFILYNRLNNQERYTISFSEQNPIQINPGRTHKIILEYPIGKIIINEEWGLIVRSYQSFINLPLEVRII